MHLLRCWVHKFSVSVALPACLKHLKLSAGRGENWFTDLLIHQWWFSEGWGLLWTPRRADCVCRVTASAEAGALKTRREIYKWNQQKSTSNGLMRQRTVKKCWETLLRWGDICIKDVVCMTEVFTEPQDLWVTHLRFSKGLFKVIYPWLPSWLPCQSGLLLEPKVNAKWMFWNTPTLTIMPAVPRSCPTQGLVNLRNQHLWSGSVGWPGKERLLLLHPPLEGRLYQPGCVWAFAVCTCYRCQRGRFECHQACLKLHWCMQVDVECCQVEDVCACESDTF